MRTTRTLALAGLIVALAACGSGGGGGGGGNGITQEQADACNTTKADAGDALAQLKALRAGGDEQTAATKIGEAQKDVQKQASSQSGAIRSALTDTAEAIGRLKVSLDLGPSQLDALNAMNAALDKVDAACHIPAP
jgi:hypothetical protein